MRTLEQVFGPAPQSHNYRGNPLKGAWQAARNHWAEQARMFNGVKAIIFHTGEIQHPNQAGLNPKQRAELAPAQRIAVKLSSSVYVVDWDLPHGQLHAITTDVEAPGSSDSNNPMTEVRPLRFPLDRFTAQGMSGGEVDKMIVGELDELVQKGIAIFLADDSMLGEKTRLANRRLLQSLAAADDASPGVAALPSL